MHYKYDVTDVQMHIASHVEWQVGGRSETTKSRILWRHNKIENAPVLTWEKPRNAEFTGMPLSLAVVLNFFSFLSVSFCLRPSTLPFVLLFAYFSFFLSFLLCLFPSFTALFLTIFVCFFAYVLLLPCLSIFFEPNLPSTTHK